MTVHRKTITVTQQQNIWIKAQVESGDFSNDSEYIRELIRIDCHKKMKLDVLRKALIDGEKSGISDRTMADILNDAKRRHNV